MNWVQLRRYKYALGVGLIVIALLIYKFRFLSLPYYWDEAWPYSVAIHDLYNDGISLMPGAISTFVARGHPLMFHFLAATWMKIFGTGILSGHSFAMFISILLIITIYLFCKIFFTERIGLIACLLFSCEPVFIAQSVFLMPEVLMALWTMLCFLTFFREKKVLFVVFGTAMLLTKESGGVLFVALFFYQCCVFVTAAKKDSNTLFKKLSLISTPVVIASVNFIIQKIKFGWFLYPFYINYISSSPKPFTENLANVAAYGFIYDGRNGLSFFIIISLLMILILKKVKFTQYEQMIISPLAVFIIFYMIFSAVNYFIPRYILCIFPPFIIIGAFLIDKAFSTVSVLVPFIVLGLVITSLFYYLQVKKSGDIDYSGLVKTDMQIVNFMEQQHLNNCYILATPVVRIDLGEPCAGYLSGKPFSNLQAEFSDKTEYCIQTGEQDESELYQQLKKQHKLELIKRIEYGIAWSEIYRVGQ